MSQIGVIQMNSGEELKQNLTKLEKALDSLAKQGVSLAISPENCLLFGSPEQVRQIAEPLTAGPIQRHLSRLCQRYHIGLVVGSFPIQTASEGYQTTCLVYDANGNLNASYAKMHLFDVQIDDAHHTYRESAIYQSGSSAVVVESTVGKLGLTICYDLRFSGQFEALAQLGANVILVPAAFTRPTGEAHWEVLLRARAIEFQCWIVAAAQCGQHSHGRETYGHSMIINPWGDVVASLGEEEGELVAEINHQQTQHIRQQMPVAQHRRYHAAIKK
ncbi:carbon-nitrogen hydrolase family protein [Thaumasiovibrio sp. DFM-14]|uniref:carbon-nitrogen hydrolase family protein n=1 Tax=Thaumasiovibrio sp. DFM-14 TaxID=3384792 RepID=UPI00399F731C